MPKTSDLDVLRSAALLLKQHGHEDARLEVAARVDKHLADGDLDGRAIWLRIGGALEMLLKSQPDDGQAIH